MPTTVQRVQRAVRRGDLVEARRLAQVLLMPSELPAVGRRGSSIGRAAEVREAARQLDISPIRTRSGAPTWWLEQDVPAIRAMLQTIREEQAGARPTAPAASIAAARTQIDRMMAADPSGLLRRILPGAVFVGTGSGAAVPVPVPQPRPWIQRVEAGALDE
jgi:LmbE family N-acetylglucosaminyl deacetylase